MGQFFSNSTDEHLKFYRTLDGINSINIGIISPIVTNPLSAQAIRIGNNGKIKRLQRFVETDDGLLYDFDNNTTLFLNKRDDGDIVISYIDNEANLSVNKIMEPQIREFFKPINFGDLSNEFDKIYDFVKLEELKINNE